LLPSAVETGDRLRFWEDAKPNNGDQNGNAVERGPKSREEQDSICAKVHRYGRYDDEKYENKPGDFEREQDLFWPALAASTHEVGRSSAVKAMSSASIPNEGTRTWDRQWNCQIDGWKSQANVAEFRVYERGKARRADADLER
jgi:hypothetical protein